MPRSDTWGCAALALAAVLMFLPSCGGGCECVSDSRNVTVTVTSASKSGAIDGVEATIISPIKETMPCQVNGSATECVFGERKPGKYSVQFTAPGYQPKTVTLTLTYRPPSSIDDALGLCTCPFYGVGPSNVTLEPAS